jgi:hypothetical protein
MAGLVPAIHVLCDSRQDVDARDEPGHDESTLIESLELEKLIALVKSMHA